MLETVVGALEQTVPNTEFLEYKVRRIYDLRQSIPGMVLRQYSIQIALYRVVYVCKFGVDSRVFAPGCRLVSQDDVKTKIADLNGAVKSWNTALGSLKKEMQDVDQRLTVNAEQDLESMKQVRTHQLRQGSKCQLV